MQLYALEAFVDRLSTSPAARDLVLKGGVLLAAYDVRRPTRDVDLSAKQAANDPESVRQLIAQVLAEPRDDGWVYEPSSADVIREGDAYSGVRVTVPCSLATARITFHVDVNVGDVVWPIPEAVTVPRLLGGAITVRGYSLSMVLAEKLVTAVQRGIANTRWRDFADVYLLTEKHAIHASDLRESIRQVAMFRAATLSPLSLALPGYGQLAQTKWAAWVRKQHLEDRLSLVFEIVLAAVQKFADPLMLADEGLGMWDPAMHAWKSRR